MQTGVLYGLWGCAITAFGFAFGGVVDFLGELLSLSLAHRLAQSVCAHKSICTQHSLQAIIAGVKKTLAVAFTLTGSGR